MDTLDQRRRIELSGIIRKRKNEYKGLIFEIIGYFLMLTAYDEWTVDYDRVWEMLRKRPPGLLGIKGGEIRVRPKAFGPWVRRNAASFMRSPERLTEELRREVLINGYSMEEAQAKCRKQYWDAGGNLRDCIFTPIDAIGLPGAVLNSLRKYESPIRDFLDLTGYTREQLIAICGDIDAVARIVRILAHEMMELKGEEGSAYAAFMERVEADYALELCLAIMDELQEDGNMA